VRPIEVLFVDKGGVLIDENDLSPQWRRLIGEFLAPRLGGSVEAWGAANIPAFEHQLERWRAAMAGRARPISADSSRRTRACGSSTCVTPSAQSDLPM